MVDLHVAACWACWACCISSCVCFDISSAAKGCLDTLTCTLFVRLADCNVCLFSIVWTCVAARVVRNRHMYRTSQFQDLDGDGSPLYRLRRGYAVFHVDMIQLCRQTRLVINPSHACVVACAFLAPSHHPSFNYRPSHTTTSHTIPRRLLIHIVPSSLYFRSVLPYTSMSLRRHLVDHLRSLVGRHFRCVSLNGRSFI